MGVKRGARRAEVLKARLAKRTAWTELNMLSTAQALNLLTSLSIVVKVCQCSYVN